MIKLAKAHYMAKFTGIAGNAGPPAGKSFSGNFGMLYH